MADALSEWLFNFYSLIITFVVFGVILIIIFVFRSYRIAGLVLSLFGNLLLYLKTLGTDDLFGSYLAFPVWTIANIILIIWYIIWKRKPRLKPPAQ